MNHRKAEAIKRQEKLRRRVREAQAKLHEGMDYAFERLLQERMDTYFRFEERLEELDRLFAQIIREIDGTMDLQGFQRLEARFNYLEDSLEEMDSEMRGRPAQRRNRRFSFFNFFRQWQEEQERAQGAHSEVRDSAEAYRILGLTPGADLRTVTATFRRLVKGLHPDARNGDRTHEPQLRKIMAAYSLIKQELKP